MKNSILKNFTVLYVEDNLDIAEEIAFFLRRHVKELYIAYDGEAGLALFHAHTPDLIVTDIQMPRLNGLDMIQAIRDINQDIPIIITTAFNESDYLLKAINMQVDGYLVKPLNLKDLTKRLEKLAEPLEMKNQLILKNAEIEEHHYYLEQFKKAVDEMAILTVSDENGIITDVNKNLEIISGFTKEELIGQPHSILPHKDMSHVLYADMWATIKSGKIWKGMIKNKKKNGGSYYVLSEFTPIFYKDGTFREYIGIRTDVTELETYKNMLKDELDTTTYNYEERKQYLKQYEDAINQTVAIVKTDRENKITYTNDKFSEMSGYTSSEIIGKDCHIIRHPKYIDEEKYKLMQKSLENKNVVEDVLINIAKDGSKYIVNTLFYPIVDLDDNVIEYLQIMHDLTEIIDLNEEIINTQKEVVLTMGAIGETRSKETGLHVKRVAEYSFLLAKLYGLSDDEANLLKQASPMHDIGKVGIPDSILNKPEKLTDEEFEVMKTHTTIGYEMLKHSERDILKASALIALTHHEKYDGRGYPNGLAGEDIHIFGRITAVADVFDALGHARVYKKAWELDAVLDFFKRENGKHFDPQLVDLMFDNLDSFLEIKEKMTDDIELTTLFNAK